MRCHKFAMVMDMSKAHQHISCEACGATWCLICEVTSIEVDPQWLAGVNLVRQTASKAHLN